MIVAICGKKGSGKSTVGDYIAKKYNYNTIAFAQPIKEMISQLFDIPMDYFENPDLKEVKLEKWSTMLGREITPRLLMTSIGTDLFRNHFHKDFWVLILKNKLKNKTVITDLRFPNELEMIPDAIVIKCVRNNNQQPGHESEMYDLPAKYTINNNGSLDDLYAAVDDIMIKESYI